MCLNPILDITVVPGETETSNNFTFTFRADRLDNETSSIELLADFNETSNVDASDISEDEVTVTFDGVTKSIDSVQQDNEGELKIILGSDERFTLSDVNGDIVVDVENVDDSLDPGEFDGAFAVRDDSSVAIASGTDVYTIEGAS
jgi:hypothetical protein